MGPPIQMNICMLSWLKQICIPMMMRSCVVFPQCPLRRRHWPDTMDFLHDPSTTSTLLLSASMYNMQPASHIAWHWPHWPAYDKQMMNLSENSWIGLDTLSSKSVISTQRYNYTSCSSLYGLTSLRTIYAKKTLSSMDELYERAKSYIQMEKMSRFRKKVR